MVKKELPTRAIQKTLINSLIGIKKKKRTCTNPLSIHSISIFKI